MAYDYTGYGISEGEPSEDACYADAEAALAYLVNVKKTPPSQILLYGIFIAQLVAYSPPSDSQFAPFDVVDMAGRLGRAPRPTLPSSSLAPNNPWPESSCRCDVAKGSCSKRGGFVSIFTLPVSLQSPLLSIFRVAFNFRFSVPGDMFCNIDIIDQVECPITIIHGTRDEVVPFWHGEVDEKIPSFGPSL